MTSNYNMITTISNFYATGENTYKFIKKIETQEQFNEYVSESKKTHNGESVLMEYYKGNDETRGFFDLDFTVDEKTSKQELKDISSNISNNADMLIQKHFPNTDCEIVTLFRPIRIVKDKNKNKKKISFRKIVINVITTPIILKKIVNKIKQGDPFMGKIFDDKVYREGDNKICMLGGVKPYNKDKDVEKQKPLELYEPDRTYNIFETAITFVEDHYDKYLDCPTGPMEDKPKSDNFAYKIVEEIKEQEEHQDIKEQRKSQYFINKMKDHIRALNDSRAEEYNDWLETIMIIVNMGENYNWDNNTIFELCDIWSRKAGDGYDQKEMKKKIYNVMGTTSNYKVGYNRFKENLKSDNYEYFKDNIDMTYYERKIEFEKEICWVNNPGCFYRTPLLPRVLNELQNKDIDQQLTASQLRDQKRNLKCIVKVEKKGLVMWEKEGFLNHWLDDEKRLTYEGLKFEPNGLSDIEKPYYKNLFNGYKADKIEIIGDIDYKDIDPILDHIKIVICDNNNDHYDWFMKWLSRIVVDPTNKPQVGVVLYSKKHGTGKNTFTEFFSNDILGFDITASVNNPERLFGKFNAVLSKCIFLTIEEAKGDIKKFMEEFKNLVTESTITIEKKGIDAEKRQNYVSLILPTNRDDILDIDGEDRRCCILEVSTCKKDNEQWYIDLHACMKKPRNAALFIKYLREEIVCNWSPQDFQKKRPITKAYKKQQSLNAKNYMKFVSHIITDDGLYYEYDDTNKLKQSWFKYAGKETICIKEKDIWKCYTHLCLDYKYTSYSYDTFMKHLTEPKGETGIYKTMRGGTKHLKFIKEEVEKWVDLFRNTDNEDIEIFKEELVEKIEKQYFSDSDSEEK